MFSLSIFIGFDEPMGLAKNSSDGKLKFAKINEVCGEILASLEVTIVSGVVARP